MSRKMARIVGSPPVNPAQALTRAPLKSTAARLAGYVNWFAQKDAGLRPVGGLIFALPELASRLANVACAKRDHRLALGDGLAQASGLILTAPPWVASARGRSAPSPSRRPALADRCRNRRGCRPTMRVHLHGFPNAQRWPARSHRHGLCGYRHVLQVPGRDAPSFACSWSS
jgi:hypothetical protein